jgi:bifunctional non-homologous end joining protein LigD
MSSYRDGKLYYFGHSGSGFSEKGIDDALARMKPLFTNKSPFENPPKVKEKIQWVKPKLVCEIAFAEWTLDEELRQTTFLGWRDEETGGSCLGTTCKAVRLADRSGEAEPIHTV